MEEVGEEEDEDEEEEDEEDEDEEEARSVQSSAQQLELGVCTSRQDEEDEGDSRDGGTVT